MTHRFRKPCKHTLCNQTTTNTDGYCNNCKNKGRQPAQIKRQNYDRYRPNAARRGYDARWRKIRIAHLKEFPFCVFHLENNQFIPATIVDHITPHKQNPYLLYDPNNLQSLCKHCHDSVKQRQERQTARQRVTA